MTPPDTGRLSPWIDAGIRLDRMKAVSLTFGFRPTKGSQNPPQDLAMFEAFLSGQVQLA